MEQPAVKSYFFGKGYRDALKIISDAWLYNHSTADRFKGNISRHEGGLSKFWIIIFNVFAIISIYVIGSIVFLLLTAIHIAVLFAVMVTVYSIFSLIWLADRSYLAFHRVFIACPKCKEKFSMPRYLCPKCGIEHTKLVPGVYGILKRKCTGGKSENNSCGQLLPTTFFNGRKELQAKCPNCDGIIDSKEAVPVCIPVVGGASVGKTCFITAVMKELKHDICPQNNLAIEFYENRNPANRRNKDECEEMIRKYCQGELQTKTANLNPSAYNFFITGKFLVPERLMYIYDIAGEALFTAEALTTQKQYDYSHGIIFLIDPLSIPEVRRRYQLRADFGKHGVTETDINDTFESFMINFRRISGLSAAQLSKVPCAIVINKTDAYDLENKIGFKAAAKVLLNPQKGKRLVDIEDAIGFTARKFLMDNGMTNFVKNVEMCFKICKYFTCSSLGHVHNGREFLPIRVFMPVKWIIGQFDKTLYRRIKPYSIVQVEGQEETA